MKNGVMIRWQPSLLHPLVGSHSFPMTRENAHLIANRAFIGRISIRTFLFARNTLSKPRDGSGISNSGMETFFNSSQQLKPVLLARLNLLYRECQSFASTKIVASTESIFDKFDWPSKSEEYQNQLAFGLLLQMVFVAIDWSRGSRPPSGAQPRASRGEQKKMRPKAGEIYRIGREAHPSAPGGGRDPRDDAAKIAFLKSITLKALV